MFRIKLIHQSSSLIEGKHTQVSVSGDKLTYDGQEYDFSMLPPNSQVEAEAPAVGLIKNDNGVIHISLIYLYNSSLAELHQPAGDYTYDVSSGEVPCPIIWRPAPELEELPVVQDLPDAPIVEMMQNV